MSDMKKRQKILILGGTSEAGELANKLVLEGHQVITSLAGRTAKPLALPGEVRVGGFGGVDGLADYLVESNIERLIDATHPFATRISKNAQLAARQANVSIEIIKRPQWEKTLEDHWIEVENLEAACEAIPHGAIVLLALGSQHIGAFATRADVQFFVRMVDRPPSPLPLVNCELVIGKPAPDAADERELMHKNMITHLVCRNSGGTKSYAKIIAARELGLPVIMIKRPKPAD